MKKKIIWLALIIVLSFQSVILLGCVGSNDILVYEEDIITSLENDYGIIVDKNYGFMNLYGDNLNLLGYDKAKEKIGKWTDNLRAFCIKTSESEDKFVYYPNGIAKKSIKENGKKVYAEIKDYIYIADFPFTYTYDEIKTQCEGIADENLKSEVLNIIENASIYIYFKGNTYFHSFTTEDKSLIINKTTDKEFVFTIGAKYDDKMYYYYFFCIKESGFDKLYIYREAWQNSSENSKIIYPSAMTKDAFINHLKTL